MFKWAAYGLLSLAGFQHTKQNKDDTLTSPRVSIFTVPEKKKCKSFARRSFVVVARSTAQSQSGQAAISLTVPCW